MCVCVLGDRRQMLLPECESQLHSQHVKQSPSNINVTSSSSSNNAVILLTSSSRLNNTASVISETLDDACTADKSTGILL